jgi:hypothetical protein
VRMDNGGGQPFWVGRNHNQMNMFGHQAVANQQHPNATQGSPATNPNTLGGPHRSSEENGDHCDVGSQGALLQRLSLGPGVPTTFYLPLPAVKPPRVKHLVPFWSLLEV